jgi:hypothetical protein
MGMSSDKKFEMDQGEFTARFCARPQNFAWFLGAGVSATAGLPTATDILWDMKSRYYCREENQEITHQDMQNDAVRDKIQSYMESKGFPPLWAVDEYTACFEKIFASDRERQRKYVHAMLGEDRAALSVGNRVLGAFMAVDFCRAVFTTNFDSIVEKAYAQVSGRSLAAFHLEGARAASNALNNEEFPIYCKLHGDFRYDSLKNLSADLATQNAELGKCLVNAGNRFGFVVTGYSGRDNSIMDLFHSVLETTNPFPHGLFWTGLKGSAPHPRVAQLLENARVKGVAAHFVPIETFDALLLRLWRNTANKPDNLDALVRKSRSTSVHIPLPQAGRGQPLVRLNALPVLSPPSKCFELSFSQIKNWDDIKKARLSTAGRLILTQGSSVLCWGGREDITRAFGTDLISITERDVPVDLSSPANLYVKGFIEEALCKALARGKPLRPRIQRHAVYLAADARHNRQVDLQPLTNLAGSISGTVPGIMAPIDERHPVPEQVTWAEAARISADYKDGHLWLLIEPDIWIEPLRARKLAIDFLDKRRGNRFNKKFNDLLDAWVHIILGTTQTNVQVTLAVFDSGTGAENPTFGISSRTAFTRRHTG